MFDFISQVCAAMFKQIFWVMAIVSMFLLVTGLIWVTWGQLASFMSFCFNFLVSESKKVKKDFQWLSRRFRKSFEFPLTILTGKKSSREHELNIALVFPDHSPSVENIISGFGGVISNTFEIVNYRFCNGEGNKALFRNRVRSVVCHEGGYDLLVPIGAYAALLTKDATMLMDEKPNIVFVGVKDPDKLKLINSYTSSGNHLTGVTGKDHDYETQIDILRLLKPQVKKVLLLSDATNPFSHEMQSTVHDILLKHNIIPKSLNMKTNNKREITRRLREHLLDPDVDTIITLRDACIEGGMKDITKLCRERKVTLFASDSASVEAGAALGFGLLEKLYGLHAADQALAILQEQKHPTDVPSLIINYPEVLFCNIEAFHHQGIQVPERGLRILVKRTKIR
jgi:putative ABC transport system substrate-binding protein